LRIVLILKPKPFNKIFKVSKNYLFVLFQPVTQPMVCNQPDRLLQLAIYCLS